MKKGNVFITKIVPAAQAKVVGSIHSLSEKNFYSLHSAIHLKFRPCVCFKFVLCLCVRNVVVVHVVLSGKGEGFFGGYFSILFLLEAIKDECWTGREREPIIDPRYSMLGPLTASQSSFSLCVCLSLCPGLFLLRTCDEGSTKQKYQGSVVSKH